MESEMNSRDLHAVLAAVATELDSPDPDARMGAWESAGDLCNGKTENVADTWAVVAGKLDGERDADVVEEAIYALGHMASNDYKTLHMIPTTKPFMLEHSGSDSADVRLAVARELPWYIGDEPDVDVVDALVRLSSDADDEVRNWATLALARMTDTDSLAIHDALLGRVNDPHEETRNEAIVGLALRGDASIKTALHAELTSDSVWKLAVKAAGALGDPEFLDDLVKLREWWDADTDLLDRAIAACDPEHIEASRSLRAEVEELLLERADVVGASSLSVRFDRDPDEMGHTLELRWIDESQAERETWYGFEYVMKRDDVRGNAGLAADHILRTLAQGA